MSKDKMWQFAQGAATVLIGTTALALIGWGLWLLIGLMAFLMETVP